MTDVKDMLIERAGSQGPPELDVDAIMRSGTRRRRRGQTLGGVAVAAVVAGVIAGGLTVLPERASTDPAQALPFTADVLTWADGDTIHYGAERVTVQGGPIDAFVKTDAGFVYVTRSGSVYVTDGASEHLVGRRNAHRRLDADDTGSIATWTEQTGGGAAEVVAYDVAERRTLLRTAGSQALGIDGDHLYLATPDEQVVRRHLRTGDTQVVPGSPAGWRDVAAGRFAFNPPNAGTVMVGDDLGPNGRRFAGWRADLSPNGSLLLTEGNDVTRLYDDAGSGAARELRHADHPIVAPVNWLGDDRFVLMGVTATDPAPGAPVDLLSCDATSGSCEVSEPGFTKYTEDDEAWTVRFPTGRSFTGS